MFGILFEVPQEQRESLLLFELGCQDLATTLV